MTLYKTKKECNSTDTHTCGFTEEVPMKKTVRLIALAFAAAALSVPAFAAPSNPAAEVKSAPFIMADAKIDKARPAAKQDNEKGVTHTKGKPAPIILASAKADKAKQHVKKTKAKAKKAAAAKKK